jgi:hypothetical protein
MKMLEIKTVDDLVRLIQACVWAFVVVILMIVFGGIVVAMLYSVTFVTQPIKSMAPIDQAYTKMLNDIVLIMASSITTIVSMFAVNKGSQALAEKLAPSLGLPPSTPTQTCPPYGASYPSQPAPASYAPSPVVAGQPFGSMPVWVNPALDESWTPGPPPVTGADHIHPEREDIAMERAIARNDS